MTAALETFLSSGSYRANQPGACYLVIVGCSETESLEESARPVEGTAVPWVCFLEWRTAGLWLGTQIEVQDLMSA